MNKSMAYTTSPLQLCLIAFQSLTRDSAISALLPSTQECSQLATVTLHPLHVAQNHCVFSSNGIQQINHTSIVVIPTLDLETCQMPNPESLISSALHVTFLVINHDPVSAYSRTSWVPAFST
ncbi:hypothetical protein SNK03_012628 [Fusarium graminearum]|uniref:Chromosome 3, complete genome n=1 Tax=Gibberella zeae (strain ATCC MYA-4620 / CBS 123657 / FGSC 9075 / NRRL 31084 / PH-1) TaxID=229533 RepID=I1S225_GIBZE|nr:hypothetical protein FGSG_10806 [Fusarium graminearum PH-1]ESU17971.1 hypothetical protein FGSG_10806 [Fusarium graminearum PH-1]EYB34069.1 hypothetical protein FG05_10806 [Fusarium graminearum]CEF88058.1 unnamed protein product [Fusarium graminearum]CZS85354.1 unnamed protein product [Fusarium graminearum]|eukprot:XP_011325593.1 hypothetical protein FGSG_10806 [Fusarium graminearum PH-1]